MLTFLIQYKKTGYWHNVVDHCEHPLEPVHHTNAVFMAYTLATSGQDYPEWKPGNWQLVDSRGNCHPLANDEDANLLLTLADTR